MILRCTRPGPEHFAIALGGKKEKEKEKKFHNLLKLILFSFSLPVLCCFVSLDKVSPCRSGRLQIQGSLLSCSNFWGSGITGVSHHAHLEFIATYIIKCSFIVTTQ